MKYLVEDIMYIDPKLKALMFKIYFWIEKENKVVKGV